MDGYHHRNPKDSDNAVGVYEISSKHNWRRGYKGNCLFHSIIFFLSSCVEVSCKSIWKSTDMKTLLTILLSLIFGITAYSQTVKKPPLIGWGGLYVSIAHTTPITKQTFRRDDFNVEFTAIFPVRNSKWAFHIEVIQSFNGQVPLLRVAAARKICIKFLC